MEVRIDTENCTITGLSIRGILGRYLFLTIDHSNESSDIGKNKTARCTKCHTIYTAYLSYPP